VVQTGVAGAPERRSPFCIRNTVFEAFRVEHPLRSAIGYRIKAGRTSIFYVPDLVYIYEQDEALFDIRMYVGDGASLCRPINRRSNGFSSDTPGSERNSLGVVERACRTL
jgi:hypothetical protein